MKFSATFELAQVDLGLYQKALDQTLREALAHAVFEYINEVLSVIPVWSGASRATFLQLARQISMYIPIVPTAWGGTGAKNHPSASSILNRIPLGERCGTGKLNMDIGTGKYNFEYTNDLHYLTYNEYHDANSEKSDPAVFSQLKRPGPYNFQKKGAAAFESSARMARLPNPWQYLKITTRSFGGGKR